MKTMDPQICLLLAGAAANAGEAILETLTPGLTLEMVEKLIADYNTIITRLAEIHNRLIDERNRITGAIVQ